MNNRVGGFTIVASLSPQADTSAYANGDLIGTAELALLSAGRKVKG